MDPRFNLTQARTDWRSALESRQAFSAAQLEELDSHLEASLEDLQKRGLTPQESFMVSVHRLGGPASLAEEYQKVSSSPAWAIRAKWMLLGILSYLAALAVTRTSTEMVGFLALKLPQGHWRLAAMVSGFLLCSALGVWLLHRCLQGKFPRIPAWISRHPFGSACAMLLAAFLLPPALAGLTTILGTHMVNLGEYSEHILQRRFLLMATPLLWFILLVFSLRKYWGKPSSVA
jgi:hypothetical protein